MGRAQIWDGTAWVDMTGGAGVGGGGDFSGDHADLINVQPSQHHARYTDAEAVAAVGSIVGLLLDSNYQSGSDAPAGSPTDLLIYTVTGMAGKLITVDVQAALRSSAMDEGEGFQGQVVIDGSAFMNARTKFGAVTASSHVHSSASHSHFMAAKSTGVTSSHVHQEGDYSTNSTTPSNVGSTTVGINVSDGESTVTPIGLRTFTPAGDFDVKLVGEIRAGSPATWFQSLAVKVFSA